MLTVKDRISLLAKERGMSIAGVERELGLGNATIQKWDTSSPSLDKLREVANFFNVPVGYLVDGEDDGYVERDRLKDAMLHDENIRSLMDMATKCSADEIRTLMELMRTWKKEL